MWHEEGEVFRMSEKGKDACMVRHSWGLVSRLSVALIGSSLVLNGLWGFIPGIGASLELRLWCWRLTNL